MQQARNSLYNEKKEVKNKTKDKVYHVNTNKKGDQMTI